MVNIWTFLSSRGEVLGQSGGAPGSIKAEVDQSKLLGQSKRNWVMSRAKGIPLIVIQGTPKNNLNYW